MSNKTERDLKEDLRIEWAGIDGALCLCFIAESIFIGWCMIHDVDIVLGRLLPYGAMLVTLWIFLKYVGQVFAFSKLSKKKRQ
ncbi:hypothetical protein [Synergistes jonesii]|uniref:hypothetical protein n=1 Tax=Synergistes jonesii TaxID=2754 RepID=UPI002A7512D2|nr:hypothetical protein [Synergistes jonesii]MDY2985318.1 hypothetical protein [Synergistes jonesii]